MMKKKMDPNLIDYYTIEIVQYHRKSELKIVTKSILATLMLGLHNITNNEYKKLLMLHHTSHLTKRYKCM